MANDRKKLREAIDDCFIVQGSIEDLQEKITDLSKSIEKDKQEFSKLKLVEVRIDENSTKLADLNVELKAKQDELTKLNKLLADNNVKIPNFTSQPVTKQTKI